MQTPDFRTIEHATWTPHPRFGGVEIFELVTRQGTGLDAEIAFVRLPVGSTPQRHIHEHSDDIIYVVRGKATMWVEGSGDLPLAEGVFLRIPRGVPHQPRNIESDLLLYNVWSPAPAQRTQTRTHPNEWR